MKLHAVSLLAAALVVAGCAGVEPLPVQVHVPLPASTAPDAVPLGRGAWRVPPFTAPGLYRERAVVYSEDGGLTLRQHPYQFWLDSPAALWRERLVAGMRAAGVEAHADRRTAAFEVRGRVQSFDWLVAGAESTARLAIELEVVDTGTGEVRLSRRYEERQPAAANDAAGTAAAAAVALSTIHRRFVADLVDAFAAR